MMVAKIKTSRIERETETKVVLNQAKINHKKTVYLLDIYLIRNDREETKKVGRKQRGTNTFSGTQKPCPLSLLYCKGYANLFVVRVWVFLIQSSSPFPAIWLGLDIRGECSTKTMGIGNGIGSERVLPW